MTWKVSMLCVLASLVTAMADTLWCEPDGTISAWVTDSMEGAQLPISATATPAFRFDPDANPELVRDLALDMSEFRVVAGNLYRGGSPVVVAGPRSGGRLALFMLARSRCVSALGITVDSPADLRSKMPEIIAACLATNNLGTAQAVAKANSVLIPLVQWQLLQLQTREK